ncbi:MAG: hypothetical protein EO766_17520 [Hydrotalea sp. AMD]|uniref:hypothetical protein n=1 Tax=Hydrotalea sp. AMD TaxID=2501297 RepID=UPI0010287404|nr:hypothetical protein [Hydrotalea sp. AMD]RWZ83861.1 MAG: hypothetical protein EO766_17520 [Hydrotalea sp. AMD]
MAKQSLEHSLNPAKYSFRSCENLSDKLASAYALSHVSLLSPANFADCDPAIIEAYLKMMGDCIYESKQMFDGIWKSLKDKNIFEVEDVQE